MNLLIGVVAVVGIYFVGFQIGRASERQNRENRRGGTLWKD